MGFLNFLSKGCFYGSQIFFFFFFFTEDCVIALHHETFTVIESEFIQNQQKVDDFKTLKNSVRSHGIVPVLISLNDKLCQIVQGRNYRLINLTNGD